MSHLTADAEANHDEFVRRVLESGLVWGLKSSIGWAVCESSEYEDTVVYPFWSEQAYAEPHCTGDWSHFVPTSVDLDAYIGQWLPGMHEDDVLVGTNWDAELSGLEWEPLDLAEQLTGPAVD